MPPGGEAKEFLEKRRPGVRFPRFDLSVLIETSRPEAADAVEQSTIYQRMERAIRDVAHDTFSITATNPKIAAVDHTRNGFFLINYFVADDAQQTLAVWEYTAGWWVEETGLDNSTLLLPRESRRSDYAIINHCRWDHLWDFMPSSVFKRSFRNYVLANFSANTSRPERSSTASRKASAGESFRVLLR
jgi:hypothetical protein